MNICIVNSFYYPDIIGGAEISVKKLAEEIVNQGEKVSILCTGNNDLHEYINNVEVYRIKENNIYSAINLLTTNDKKFNKYLLKMYFLIDVYNVFNYFKIKRTLKIISPDVIHINNLYGLSLIIIKVAKELKIPIVMTVRDYSLLYEDTENKISKYKRKIALYITNKSDIVTAPSQYTLDYFTDRGYFTLCKNKVIYNAIDLNINKIKKIHSKKKSKILQKEKVKFVYLGRLEKNKGIGILLESFSKVKNSNIELYIAGNGTEKELVLDYCESDTRIRYLGFLDEEGLDYLLDSADVLIIPSIWPEPFGRVVLDAYKYCIPVIGTNVGGIPEIVDYNTGILVKPNSEDDLIKGILYFSNKKNILKKMNCLENKIKQFNVVEQAKQFIEVYKEILRS